MFTGIVEEMGLVCEAPPRLQVRTPSVWRDSGVGASVCVSGVCLTVVARGEGTLAFDISEETLARSSLEGVEVGTRVNLERPVQPCGRLGGHVVQGHVDAVGRIERLDKKAEEARLSILAPPTVERYIVEKGSIAVDGVSLTVASVSEGAFSVALIPHTLRSTTLGTTRVGDPVNLEADLLAKYVERLIRREP
jgi:riboflavin synthase